MRWALANLCFDTAPDAVVHKMRWSQSCDPYLQALRSEFRLSQILFEAGATTSTDKVLAICHWLRRSGRHDGRAKDLGTDPRTLLLALRRGEAFRCVEYSAAAVGCLAAVGLTARVLGLMTSDMETRRSRAGHVACEVFLPELRSWILVDPQACALPLLNGQPLHAVALRQALTSRARPDLDLAGTARVTPKTYFRWIGRYLYYFRISLDNRLGVSDLSNSKLMLMPIGARRPDVMQRRWPLVDTYYTHSLPTFYQHPPRIPGPGQQPDSVIAGPRYPM